MPEMEAGCLTVTGVFGESSDSERVASCLGTPLFRPATNTIVQFRFWGYLYAITHSRQSPCPRLASSNLCQPRHPAPFRPFFVL
jgi:hypothetical protein